MYNVNDMHRAAGAGDEAALTKLLSQSTTTPSAKSDSADGSTDTNNINAPDSVGRTALFYAVVSKSVAAVQALLDAGASCVIQDVDGRIPLHWAAYHGKPKVTKLLLAKTPRQQVAVKDKEGRTPLHWATVQDAKSVKVVPLLLKAGADVSAPDAEGMTPLHWAVYHNSPKASPSWVDCERRTLVIGICVYLFVLFVF